jgi:methyl-accepting chemotaxis protein
LDNKKIRKDPEAKFAVEGNKWDRHTRERIAANVKEFAVAAQQLAGEVDTGFEAMSDTLLSLFKVNPKLRDTKSMRPSFLINHAVAGELMKLKEYDKARNSSVGDPVATGLAAATLEPDLEVIFDSMEKAREMAQDIEQMMQEAEDYADRIDELMEKAQESDEFSDEEASVEEMQAALQELKDKAGAPVAKGIVKEVGGKDKMAEITDAETIDKVYEAAKKKLAEHDDGM